MVQDLECPRSAERNLSETFHWSSNLYGVWSVLPTGIRWSARQAQRNEGRRTEMEGRIKEERLGMRVLMMRMSR
jgi:hypothetical protein